MPTGTAAVLAATTSAITRPRMSVGTADWNMVITVTLITDENMPMAMNKVSATAAVPVTANPRTQPPTPPTQARKSLA